ncbi:hypothetical protein F8388_004489, partial [Cannabis sativa]
MKHPIKEVFADDFLTNLWFFQDLVIHYVRYQEKSILASKDMPLLMNKWKFYLVHLRQCHFYVWSQAGSVSINQLSKHAFGFLGYLSSMRINLSVVRVNAKKFIKYILRLSCVKTLARKHKSTVPTFLKRLGSELLDKFFTEEEEVLYLIFPRTYSTLRRLYKGRIWYLDIFCINDL